MKTDLLNAVRERLRGDLGNLRHVAEETDICYDTLLRIKNGEGDPGYAKVRAIAIHYKLAQHDRSP